MFTESRTQTRVTVSTEEKKQVLNGGLNETGLVGVSCLHITIHPLFYSNSLLLFTQIQCWKMFTFHVAIVLSSKQAS